MKVTLGQSRNRKIESRDVASFSEASAAVREYIERNDLGAGCSPRSNAFAGGDVLEGNEIVARVSYNGRVWSPCGTLIQESAAI